MSKLKITIGEIDFYFDNVEDLTNSIKKNLDENEKKYLELKTNFTKIKKQKELLTDALKKFSNSNDSKNSNNNENSTTLENQKTIEN